MASFLSRTEHDAKTRREILENGENRSPDILILERKIKDLEFKVSRQPNVPTTTRQGIQNMIRNGDHAHSVNTWWEAAASATDKDKECANVYAYPKLNPITITDAAITTGTPGLTSASNPFTAAMVGRFVQVNGAGAAGATLVTTILTYIGPGSVTLAANAGTTVAGATARINLQKLGHTNKLNAAATNPSDALKDASHSAIGTNISDPDWKKDNGTIRFGSTGVIGYSFGRFADNGTTYTALHQLFSGREPFARLNLVRANPYVKMKGKLFLGIYNNNESVLDWVRGSAFTLDSIVDGTPTATISTDYFVVLETDLGFTLVSEVETVALAPTDTGFVNGARIRLTWTNFAGTTRATVYRRRAAGNVFKMEEFSSGANSWADVNLSSRVDTGVTTFPTFTDAQTSVAAYWASPPGELDDVAYDGQPERFWEPIQVRLPFPPTVNMAAVFDPHFIVGLTQPLATEVSDVVTNSTVNVTSAVAQFTAAMTGKAFTLTKSDGTTVISGTFTYVSATNGTLSTAATWTGTGSTLVIDDSQPRGLFYDLVGVSLNDGEWDFNVEDNNRPQSVASNPNGSTQGNTGGGEPTETGGTGGVDCVLDSSIGKVRGASNNEILLKRADEITLEDVFWNGLGYEDDDFNEIEWIKVKWVTEIHWLLSETKRLGCTKTHRIVNDEASYRNGISVKNLRQGIKVLISDEKSVRLETISALPVEAGRFKVISFGLKKNKKRTAHLMVFNDVVNHNRKRDEFPINQV